MRRRSALWFCTLLVFGLLPVSTFDVSAFEAEEHTPTPAGRCEERCHHQYDIDAEACKRVPKAVRRACWERAMERLAQCIRKCPRRRE
jgi:hypothetical protein